MRVAQVERRAGGWVATVEIERAFRRPCEEGRHPRTGELTTSRFVTVPVPAEVAGRSREERLDAIRQAVGASMDDIAGADLEAVAETRAVWERRMERAWAEWWRWKTTRDEAAARGLPTAVLSALGTRVDQAWAAYLAAIQAWRAAP